MTSRCSMTSRRGLQQPRPQALKLLVFLILNPGPSNARRRPGPGPVPKPETCSPNAAQTAVPGGRASSESRAGSRAGPSRPSGGTRTKGAASGPGRSGAPPAPAATPLPPCAAFAARPESESLARPSLRRDSEPGRSEDAVGHGVVLGKEAVDVGRVVPAGVGDEEAHLPPAARETRP